MSKFVSAGHCITHGPNFDPGAPGIDKRWEANETVKVRNRVIQIIRSRGYNDIIQDADTESLQQYLNRAKTGGGSAVVEFHFNAGPAGATGTETLTRVVPQKYDTEMAREFSAATSRILGIQMRGNQGVKTEADTRHKRLALMKEAGIVNLVEICFISSPKDMAAFDAKFEPLCQAYADIIIKYDKLIA